MIDKAPISDRAKADASRVFQQLGEAEAHVHGMQIEKVHFHEVGAADSIADIVGACLAFDLLGVQEIHTSPDQRRQRHRENGAWPAPGACSCHGRIAQRQADLLARSGYRTDHAHRRRLGHDAFRNLRRAPRDDRAQHRIRRRRSRFQKPRECFARPDRRGERRGRSDAGVRNRSEYRRLKPRRFSATRWNACSKPGALDAAISPLQMKKNVRPGSLLRT